MDDPAAPPAQPPETDSAAPQATPPPVEAVAEAPRPQLRLEDLTPAQIDALARTIATEAWRRGDLRHKLHETQLKIYDAIKNSPHREHFLLCSRRLGKSFLLLLIAFETAIQRPGSRILFIAPWQKDAADIASDLAFQLLSDCPESLRPKYRAQDKEFVFERPGKAPSIVRLKGANGEHAQYLRGGAADLVLLDEAGLVDDLKHVLEDVVSPMTLTTRGRILIATTPPRSPGHDSASIYERLAAVGAVSLFTLRDAPHIPREEKARELITKGEKADRVEGILDGTLEPETTTAKREYFCQFVTDAASAVVPEMATVGTQIVQDIPRPAYFDAYTSVDPGFHDKTGILFAYLHFKLGAIVVEDEALLHRASTNDIAKAILDREYSLWGDTKQVYMRVLDDDPRLAQDLFQLHGLVFRPAQKQDSLGAINYMRTQIGAKSILIHPRCQNLVRQLRNATWNTKATDFERAGEQSPDGHYDLVAALKYLCRAVNRHKNPFPSGYADESEPQSRFRSPRRRFWGGSQTGLLANTPAGRRLSGKKQT